MSPGGVIAISGFGPSAFQPMSDRFEARIRGYGVTFPVPRRPFPWQRLNDHQEYRDLRGGAGLQALAVREAQIGYWLADADAWWDIVWNTGYRGPVAQLAPNALARF
jgi:hypothetical protein